MPLEHSHLSAEVLTEVTAIAGEGKECGCARPLDVIPAPITPDAFGTGASDRWR